MNSTGTQGEALFQKLRALRRRLADNQDVSAFVVFDDSSLREMANSAPRTREEFLRIRGVGPQKLKWYGQEFLDVIRNHISSVSNQTAHSESKPTPLDGAARDTATEPPVVIAGKEAQTTPGGGTESGRQSIASMPRPPMPRVVLVMLWAADLLIWLMLRPRSDERLTRPTMRVPWPYGLKQQLMSRQNNTCVYCGHRRPDRAFEIDHMTPVLRGGSNEFDNLQVICRWCNMRKGIQTDEEFRARYARLIPSKRLTPPARRISQSEFSGETQHTSQSNTVRKFKISRFYTKREKILTGCFVVYAVTALAILVPLYYLGFEGLALGLPAMICGFAVGAGIWFRAYMTGAMMEEE